MAAADPSSPNVQSVERALAILEFIDESKREWRMSAISRKLGIPKSTAHVLVLTLERAGYIERTTDSRGYTLGIKARQLGRSRRRLELAESASPHMERLAEQTKLTVHLAIRDGNQARYIQKADDPASIYFDTYIGKRVNLHCTAVGKIILAHEEIRFSRSFLAHQKFSRHTINTITSPVDLRNTLESVRKRGCALDDEEEELETRCLSVPVFAPDGTFLAALGVAGTLNQIPNGRTAALLATVRRTANAINLAHLSTAALASTLLH